MTVISPRSFQGVPKFSSSTFQYSTKIPQQQYTNPSKLTPEILSNEIRILSTRGLKLLGTVREEQAQEDLHFWGDLLHFFHSKHYDFDMKSQRGFTDEAMSQILGEIS